MKRIMLESALIGKPNKWFVYIIGISVTDAIMYKEYDWIVTY